LNISEQTLCCVAAPRDVIAPSYWRATMPRRDLRCGAAAALPVGSSTGTKLPDPANRSAGMG
jgi:hypothetical protein